MRRLVAIGDIHGCHKTLVNLLQKITPGADDTLIFLGDYIDRGPSSKEVVDTLMELGQSASCIFLRGNHEQTLLEAIDKERSPQKKWFFSSPKNEILTAWKERFGGQDTLDSYGIENVLDIPEKHVEWFRKTALYHRTEKEYFVHAGFNFSLPDILTDTTAMLWTRDFDYNTEKAGGRTVVHGHVPVTIDFTELCTQKKQLGFLPLDTGCVYIDRPGMGYLTAYDFTNEKIIAVKNCE